MKGRLTIILYIAVITIFGNFNIHSLERMGVTQSQIEKGHYVPRDLVTIAKLKFLPISAGTADYAFFQSIKKVSNIVIGKFKIGEREILLIQDENADGKVDLVASWSIDQNRIDKNGSPDTYCTPEDFKKLKEAIINGKNETVTLGGKNVTITPNKEGMPVVERLIKTPSNIAKHKQGFRISQIDPDEHTKEMLAYSFSFNDQNNTADMAFDVKYYYSGRTRISPTVNHGVYCLQSQDPFVIETVKKLKEMTGKYLSK